MKHERWIKATAGVLVVIGALNWGLVAFDWNIVEKIAGTGVIAKCVYGLVGIAGLVHVPTVWKQLTGGR